MRIAIKITLIVLSAWLLQELISKMEGEDKSDIPYTFSLIDTLDPIETLSEIFYFGAPCLLAALCLFCVFSLTRHMLGFFIALTGAACVVLAESTSIWHILIRIPAWQAILVFYALVLGYLLLVAKLPIFKSGKQRVRDGGDHLSVGEDGGDTNVFPKNRVLCRREDETYSKTCYGGGSYVVPTSTPTTTYLSNGQIVYGTSYGTRIESSPVYSYETTMRTGKFRFRFDEVGPDHGLLTAKLPPGVHIVGRHQPWDRRKNASIVLGWFATIRFEAWRRLHGKMFFQQDGTLPRRIAKAASAHKANMKRVHGRTSSQEMALDHELGLIWFIGLGKKDAFVQHVPSGSSFSFGIQDVRSYWNGDSIHLPDCDEKIRPSGKIKAKISEWAQLSALRQT